MERERVKIDSHLPERRRRQVVTVYGTCCTCCCCCCLHSLGAIIGAVTAPALIKLDVDKRLASADGAAVRRRWLSATSLYWWIFAGLVLIGAAALVAEFPSKPDDMMFWGLVASLFLPALQLVSTGITYVVVHFVWERNERDFQCAQLVKITLGSFYGCAGGILMMAFGSVAMVFFGK